MRLLSIRSGLVAAFVLVALAGPLACGDDAGSVADAGASGDAQSTNDASLGAIPDDARTADPDAAADGGIAADDSGVDAGVPVRITFAAKVGARPFRCGDTYPAVGEPAREITPVDLRFYVHDVRVVDAEGVEMPLALTKSPYQHREVALLDFEDGTGSCTDGDVATNVALVGHVPRPFAPGSLRFRLGVPMDLNHEDLSTQPPPLERSSLFWAWRSGHIFFAAVARVRLPVDGGAGTAPYNHYTHLGSVDCVGDPASGILVTSCAKPNTPEVSLAAFDPATSRVVVDLAAVKAGIDLGGKGCHADGEPCAIPYGRLGIDWTTGGYIGAQSVFGVE